MTRKRRRNRSNSAKNPEVIVTQSAHKRISNQSPSSLEKSRILQLKNCPMSASNASKLSSSYSKKIRERESPSSTFCTTRGCKLIRSGAIAKFGTTAIVQVIQPVQINKRQLLPLKTQRSLTVRRSLKRLKLQVSHRSTWKDFSRKRAAK